MKYFYKMVKNSSNKDLDAIEKFLHLDFLFVADFEILRRDDRNNFMNETSGMIKTDREKHYDTHYA